MGEALPHIQQERVEQAFIDPLKLLNEAMQELTLGANSGVFDHEKIARLRRDHSAMTAEDELLVMYLPKDSYEPSL